VLGRSATAFSLGGPPVATFERLVALAAVGGEGADELVAEVDVDELADLEDADGGAGVAAGDDDPELVVGDDAAAVDLAQDRVRRVARSRFRLGERELAEGRLGRPTGEVALGGGVVADSLVGALAVVGR